MATVNGRQKSKSSSSLPSSDRSGRSLLDYSIVGCFILILGLVVILLDTYEYVNVGLHLRGGGGVTTNNNAESTSTQLNAREEGALMEAMTSSYATKQEDIDETNREIDKAKTILAKKQAEVETIVKHMDDDSNEVVAGVVTTPEEKKIVDEIKEVVIMKESNDTLDQVKEEELIVEAVVEKELGIDQWCGTCIWKDIFKCDHRLTWLMNKYTETEIVIKESLIKDGHCTGKEGGK